MYLFIENFIELIQYQNIIIYLFLGFIIGSIPFGLIIVKISGYGDIRKIGSGNIGATNVLRTGNKFIAVLTLIFDISKSFIILYLAEILFKSMLNEELLITLFLSLSLLSILGHMFSPFLLFKGGKGIATAAGILLFLSWPCALFTLLIWLFFALIFKTSSLGGLSASITAPMLFWLLSKIVKVGLIPDNFYIYDIEIYIVLIITTLIMAKHVPNIRRIIKGTESKI
ncbi:glycerol-3-phosphate 1-O-acyltransferase PlsY [Alphaproteobacteria bacterium]|nr:glycerol-3-phosphate 1-O-acyltransferase PlsY [Alphaproteobacteria bacterium]